MSMHYFDLSVYPLYFGFCTSKKAFVREMKRLNVTEPPAFNLPDADMTVHYFDCPSSVPSCRVIVCANKKDLREKSLTSLAGLLAHEATHVWQEAKRQMNEKDPGREIEAYAIQFFTQCMFDKALEYRVVVQ